MTAHPVGAETQVSEKTPVSKARFTAPFLILLSLILLGFWLRVHHLDAFSFWTDEGLTPERSGYSLAQLLRNDILIQGVVTKDTHPPLYYLILHATRPLFGLSDFAFRYPSVLFGALLIPLLYQLGRRLGGRGVGLIVALLATVNPLQVYYSQEARMYTLLVLLVTGMSYVLWEQLRATSADGARHSSLNTRHTTLVISLLLYALLAALAVYTHYTAVFLVAAQGVFWVWILWRGGLKRVILGAAVVAALVAIPLIPYTVPRLLAGAEANYYAVPPLTMLLDVVRFFNLGLTADFSQPFTIALNLLAFALLLLGLWAAASYDAFVGERLRDTSDELRVTIDEARVPRWSFVRPVLPLSWLLAPVLGLMLGSLLFKPMYQGVRHIMAGSPAFLLLLAFGIWAIGSWMPVARDITDRAAEEDPLTGWSAWRAQRPNFNPLALIPLSLLLIGSIFALVNLYTNPAYVKDDFRAIVSFIETRAGGRDVIVYNNAVLLPLHEHYRRRPDIAVTALPVYPQYATGQEPELAALARDYDRIWFVTDPPADGRDDDALIRGWLDANRTVVVNQLFPARTTEARVIAFAAPDGGQPMAAGAGWPRMPQLTGVSLDSPLALPTLWVDLFWEGERPVVNATLLFTLTGPDGVEAFRHAQALLPHADTRWRDGATNRIGYHLPLPPGTPPGTYTLAVTPESGDTLVLGDVEIAATSDWPAAPEVLFDDTLPAAIQRPVAEWPNGLTLAAIEPWDDAVRPGNNLPVTLFWRAGPDGIDLSDLRYRLEVIDSRGEVLRVQEDRPGAPWLGRVPGGALLREDTGLYIRPDTAPGDYRLRWTLLEGTPSGSVAPVGEPLMSGRITVEPWPLETTVPPAPNVVEADFGSAIRLHSYLMGVPTDGLLSLTLYWQTLARPDDYMVFVHLVDESGHIAGQIDSIPVGGARPTTTWRVGEVVTDNHNLPVPDDLPPGRYDVYVGLYNPADGARPSVTVDGAPQPDNQLRVGTLELPWETP